MNDTNWVAALGSVAAAIAAFFSYLKTRRVDEQMHNVAYHVNGRYEDLLTENRRLREVIAADTGVPDAVTIVNDALNEDKDKKDAGSS